MKKSAKSGLIVLILLILVIAAYTSFTILRTGKSDSAKLASSQSSYRVAEDSESYNPSAARAYKSNFIAALYIE